MLALSLNCVESLVIAVAVLMHPSLRLSYLTAHAQASVSSYCAASIICTLAAYAASCSSCRACGISLAAF